MRIRNTRGEYELDVSDRPNCECEHVYDCIINLKYSLNRDTIDHQKPTDTMNLYNIDVLKKSGRDILLRRRYRPHVYSEVFSRLE